MATDTVIKNKVEMWYQIIADAEKQVKVAESELEKIREWCSHTETFTGMYLDVSSNNRATSGYYNATICSACNKMIKNLDTDPETLISSCEQ